jgi:hypothetical protein
VGRGELRKDKAMEEEKDNRVQGKRNFFVLASRDHGTPK